MMGQLMMTMMTRMAQIITSPCISFANRKAPHTYYLVYPRLRCLLDGGVGVTIYIFQKDNDFPTTFQQRNVNTVQSSTLAYFIQYPTILPNLADSLIWSTC